MADKLSVNQESGDFAIETVEMHTGGEPLRIIRKGYPKVDGRTILEKRRFLRENLDSYRTMLMHEPRGHSDMYGALIVPPDHPDADIGVIFMHNEGIREQNSVNFVIIAVHVTRECSLLFYNAFYHISL